MRKSTKEYILTKSSTSGGDIYLETITVRVKAAPYNPLEETVAKTFKRTAFNVIKENVAEMGHKIHLALNGISLLQDELDDEERLIVVGSLYTNINMIYERMLDTILPEVSLMGNQGEEFGVVVDKVRTLILKNQQVVNEVTGLISNITDSAGQNITADTGK